MMNTTTKSILLLMAFFLAISCSSDDETTAPPDPSDAFVGEYISKEYSMNYNGNIAAMPAGAKMSVEIVNEDPNKIEMDIHEIVRESLESRIGPNLVHFKNNIVAEVSGNEFEFGITPFQFYYSNDLKQGNISGNGTIDGDILTMKYEMSFKVMGSNSHSGTVPFEKQ